MTARRDRALRIRCRAACVAHLLAPVLAVILSGACADDAPPKVETYEPVAATDRLDIAYTTKPRTLALDLYTPAGTPPFPVIVWIHGGGWQSGTKSLSRDHPARRQRERGYAVASVEYRLSGEAIFPAQIQDCKAAVRFLRGHAREYGLDANRVAAWGSSAGGHLVALMGTSGGVAALEDPGQGDAGQSSRVQAVVDWYGPTDFLSTGPYSPGSAEAAMLGCAVTACPDRARAAGPLTYVDHGDPPFFIEHGTRDTTVKPLHSELLHAALLVAGVPSTYVLIEGAGHGGAEFMTAANVARIEAFLDGVLR